MNACRSRCCVVLAHSLCVTLYTLVTPVPCTAPQCPLVVVGGLHLDPDIAAATSRATRLHFERPHPDELRVLLQRVCARERVEVQDGVLDALAGAGDIRCVCCLPCVMMMLWGALGAGTKFLHKVHHHIHGFAAPCHHFRHHHHHHAGWRSCNCSSWPLGVLQRV